MFGIQRTSSSVLVPLPCWKGRSFEIALVIVSLVAALGLGVAYAAHASYTMQYPLAYLALNTAASAIICTLLTKRQFQRIENLGSDGQVSLYQIQAFSHHRLSHLLLSRLRILGITLMGVVLCLYCLRRFQSLLLHRPQGG